MSTPVKVVLLGDSIRQIGYGPRIPDLLGPAYSVFQPKENCRFAKYTLRMLFDLRKELQDTDIIHWNNGLWDVCDLFGDGRLFSGDEEYVENMLRIADLLLAITPRVIFATTTPVRPDHPHNRNTDIARFNALLVPELMRRGVAINDLYALVKPHLLDYIRADDMIHLTPVGIEACAGQVAAAIRAMR